MELSDAANDVITEQNNHSIQYNSTLEANGVAKPHVQLWMPFPQSNPPFYRILILSGDHHHHHRNLGFLQDLQSASHQGDLHGNRMNIIVTELLQQDLCTLRIGLRIIILWTEENQLPFWIFLPVSAVLSAVL